MVLIRAPPSGLIKAVCLFLLLEASDARVLRDHLCQCKASSPHLSSIWKLQLSASLERVNSFFVFFHSFYLGLKELVGIDHRFDHVTLLHSSSRSHFFSQLCSQFSFDKKKKTISWRERSNKRRPTGRNVRVDHIFSGCTLDENRKRQ